MISNTIQDALNAQIQAELASAHLYLAMSAYCGTTIYRGAAHWLRLQHGEETGHATKMLDYLVDRGGKVSLGALEAPRSDFGSLEQVFTTVLEHERHVSERIHKLYELAVAERDVATQVFLQWFVNEQVEEEANASMILERLRAVGDRPGTIIYLDKELGKRSAGTA
ncbi:MAG TPA: ferritin [Planctomycetota bacterium]|nr:ferritin [Planctomycetota bacterium]